MARNPARRFEELVVWQKAHALVLAIYRLSAAFPRHETYGLTAQVRRAAVSVPANIAEGFRKSTRADKARFFNISQGSLEEVRYYLILAADLGYADTADLSRQLDEVGRLLDSYARALRRPASLAPTLLLPLLITLGTWMSGSRPSTSSSLSPASCLQAPVSCLLSPVST